MQSYKIKNTELNLNPVFSIYTKYFIVPEKNWLHIDYKQMGLGGDDSWSPRVHKEFLLKNKVYHYTYAIEPL